MHYHDGMTQTENECRIQFVLLNLIYIIYQFAT
jgi:hypothetical protein